MTDSKNSHDSDIHEIIQDTDHDEYLVCGINGLNAQRQGLAPMSADQMVGLKNFLDDSNDIEVIKSYRPKKPRFNASSAFGSSETQEHHVVRMNSRKAEELKQSGRGNIIVGKNLPLTYEQGYIWYPSTTPTQVYNPQTYPQYALNVQPDATVAPRATKPVPHPVRLGSLPEAKIQFSVLGVDNKPVEGATVTLQGSVLPQTGKTNKKGELTLSVILHPGQSPEFIQVSNVANCWDFYLRRPKLTNGEVNIIRLTPLSETIPDFETAFRFGWGQCLMGLDKSESIPSAEGIKIAIVDSGTDNSHPLLSHIQQGEDLSGSGSGGWHDDELGHGTHVSGVISANGKDGKMQGFAPKAEIHSLKIFPGGNLSTLIEALDYCIDNNIDVVNLSLGTNQSSDAFTAVEQKIEEAAHAGVACIVAAGNNGGAVQYPASSPNTLAVAALGKLGEFPKISWNQDTIQEELVSPHGLFSPSYTSMGPEVAVAAPGSAIISTWPGNSFAPDSGTSMAAPHITGLAANILASQPEFKNELEARNADRVKRLFDLIGAAACPIPEFGRDRTGLGMPTLQSFIPTLPY